VDTKSRHLRATLASHARFRPEDTETADQLRSELRAARAEDYIKRLVDEAPPLTSEQRDRLAVLLRGGAPPGQTAIPVDGGTTLRAVTRCTTTAGDPEGRGAA
jgi:hypothetical protein